MKNQDLTTNEIFMTIASIFLIISMFVFLGSNALAAVTMGILGILLFPQVNRKIKDKLVKGNKTKNYVKILLEIIMFVFILFNLASTENAEEENELAEGNISNNAKIENVSNSTNNINLNNVTTANVTMDTDIGENIADTNSQVNTTTEVTESKNNKENKTQTTTTTPSSSSSSSTSSSASVSSGKQSSSSSVSSSTTNSQTVYVTPTGKRYHLKATCGGKNSRATTLSNAKSMGLTPCKKCAQ